MEPGTFNGLVSLTELWFDFNKMKLLYADMFSNLSSCTLMSLASNEISEIEPGSFNGLRKVEVLYLNANRLTTLRMNMFQGLVSLKVLYLFYSDVNFIEENTFSNLKKLEMLRLHGNELESLTPGIFCGLESLKTIYLKNNHLTMLPEAVFSDLPRPLRLVIDQNPLQCEAELCWLKQKEKQGTITLGISIIPEKAECVNGTDWNTWSCDETGIVTHFIIDDPHSYHICSNGFLKGLGESSQSRDPH